MVGYFPMPYTLCMYSVSSAARLVDYLYSNDRISEGGSTHRVQLGSLPYSLQRYMYLYSTCT